MIARELTEFFAGFSPNGGPALQRAGDLTFLSNVNACYSRACWAELRFPDLAYSEDQAFGRAMLEAGWVKVFHPGAAVRHAHDYGPVEFMKRYFDEYRGLREASGHVEPLRPCARPRARCAPTPRWMREQGVPARPARALAGALGGPPGRPPRRVGARSRGRARCPAALQQRAVARAPRRAEPPRPSVPRGRAVARRPVRRYEDILRLSREGAAPLDDPVPGMSERPMHVAVVIPHFVRGSGGHSTIFTLLARLEELGHTCSIWLYDPHASDVRLGAPSSAGGIVEEFVPLRAPVHRGFDALDRRRRGARHGLGHRLRRRAAARLPRPRLPHPGPRAGVLRDLRGVARGPSAPTRSASTGSPPAAGCATCSRARYGQRGSWFRLGVHPLYRPRPVERRRDTVIFYARDVDPAARGAARRARARGAAPAQPGHALRPLRPGREAAAARSPTSCSACSARRCSPGSYSEATVGLCLSLTNYSLIPQEMMGCGLPCVDLEGSSTQAEIGTDGGVEFGAADPVALADALEVLLDRPRALGEALRGGPGVCGDGLVGRGREAGRGRAARGSARARASRRLT